MPMPSGVIDFLQRFRPESSPFTMILAILSLAVLAACGGGSSGGGGGNSPPTPMGLTATPEDFQVNLTWTPNSGASSYNVKRATTSGGPYTKIGSSTVPNFLDDNVIEATTYYYVVSAANANGESGNSAEALAIPGTQAPTGLTATAGDSQVSLTWDRLREDLSFNLKRSTISGGPYIVIANPTSHQYADTGLTNGTTYFYVVAAQKSFGVTVDSAQVSATPSVQAPTGLAAFAGNAKVTLTWNAISDATSYNVKRGTANGGPYSQVSSVTNPTYTDTGLSNGTTYYYVVTALIGTLESANSTQASAKPSGSITNVSVNVDALANRHPISPYVYGGAFPKDATAITNSGLSVVRWGGNGASTYNWELGTTNADSDYFFEDFAFSALNNSADSDSTQFIKDVKSAGSLPLMTMVMLPWVAQSAETSTTQGGTDNNHWSFSVARHGAQCHVDQYNVDAGDGIVAGANCDSSPTYITADSTDLNNTYFPLLDDHTQTCSASTCLYRNDWAAALAAAFGSSPHFYDMDNEIDIWGGTHRDIHPNPATYNELRDVYLTESRNLKTWDSSAIRFGPVSCCWYFYWRSATGASDTSSHGGVDFLPWWVNEVAWSDLVDGSRSLDVFDIHAYPDADTNGLTTAQKQALAVSIYRDWWDPTFNSAASYIVNGGFSNEPVDSKPFRIPRMRAILNQAYLGTQFSMTEWSAAFAGESDFSTALGDADAYGILGRERVYLATRWTTPDPANPNYLALRLFTNYDGANAHHGFGKISVSDTNNGNPNLFSSYAGINAAGTAMSVLVLNKDPQNTAQVTFAFSGYTPTSFATYTLASSNPTAIATSFGNAWSATQNFAPYSATLLLITGSIASNPASEWDLNPDTIMVPAGGSVTLNPKITSGSANVTLTASTNDSGIASVNLTQPSVTTTQIGTVAITAGTTPGFYRFTVTGTDSVISQTQGGWIVVGNPAATLAKTTGDGQTGTKGTALPTPLTVTLSAGSSGGTNTGASILFSTSAGSLSTGTTSGTKLIVVTDSSGVSPAVTLTLPSTTGTVTITAAGPYGLGHPVATFTETSQ